MSFGSNLERIRKDNKVSQAKLGELLGLTQQMVSSYEKDASSPNVEILCKIADYFHVSIDSLVDHVIESPDAQSPEARFLRYFESLTSADKEKCIVVVKTILEDRTLNRKPRKSRKNADKN